MTNRKVGLIKHLEKSLTTVTRLCQRHSRQQYVFHRENGSARPERSLGGLSWLDSDFHFAFR